VAGAVKNTAVGAVESPGHYGQGLGVAIAGDYHILHGGLTGDQAELQMGDRMRVSGTGKALSADADFVAGITVVDGGSALIGGGGRAAAEDAGAMFHTVQGAEDAARLRAGGSPWPTGASRSSLGQGVYSFGSRAEAESYATHLAGRGASDLEVMSFNVSGSDLASFKSLNIDSLADPEAFLSKYSELWGGTPNHGFEYLTRGTQFGTEHFFDSSVFGRLNFGG
jgi:hypothetical protein